MSMGSRLKVFLPNIKILLMFTIMFATISIILSLFPNTIEPLKMEVLGCCFFNPLLWCIRQKHKNSMDEYFRTWLWMDECMDGLTDFSGVITIHYSEEISFNACLDIQTSHLRQLNVNTEEQKRQREKRRER